MTSDPGVRGGERQRLWELWRTVTPELDDYAALRSTPTAVVVLTPESRSRSARPDEKLSSEG
jgi:hypothetical protein